MPQRAEVMLNQLAKLGIPLYIVALLEALRHPVEVNAQATRQVHIHITAACQSGLVACRLFTGTLFHIQMRRIEYTLYSSPRRQLLQRRLSTRNLLQCHRQINSSIFRALQCQFAHIVSSMLADEVPCLFINHGTKIQIKFKLSIILNSQFSIFN